MTNTKSVRLGNQFLTMQGNVTLVTDIISVDGYSNTEFLCYGYSSDEVTPILITEEHLIQFGFKRNGSGFSRQSLFLSFSAEVWDVYLLNSDGEDPRFFQCTIFIHDLQNLWFQLNNYEITEYING